MCVCICLCVGRREHDRQIDLDLPDALCGVRERVYACVLCVIRVCIERCVGVMRLKVRVLCNCVNICVCVCLYMFLCACSHGMLLVV